MNCIWKKTSKPPEGRSATLRVQGFFFGFFDFWIFFKKKLFLCQDQLSFPAMQVTSSHVSIWCNLLASYDEYTALVKIGNVASEHVK